MAGIYDIFTKDQGSKFNIVRIHRIGSEIFSKFFGLTEESIKEYFLDKLLHDKNADAYNKILQIIKLWYNGY